jgi:hypothetical protein
MNTLHLAHMQGPFRQPLPAAQLYAILDREFKKRRPVQCRSCNVPLPYYQSPADDVSANWFIGTPHHCEYGCHLVIAELLVQLWTRYDLDRTPER